jgi:hypothetical protein
LFLDLLKKIISKTHFSRVYKCTFTSNQGGVMEVAVKSFNASDFGQEAKIIERDIQHGTDPRLRSEYTIVYLEEFDMLGCLSVSMPLMKMSLDKYIQSQNILTDEVFINVN